MSRIRSIAGLGLVVLTFLPVIGACGPAGSDGSEPEATCPPVIRHALDISIVSGGSPVCDVSVVDVTNADGTEPALTFVSDCMSFYQSTQTASGTYSVRVEADGFEDQTVSDIVVTDDGCVAQTQDIEIEMIPL